MEYRTAHILKMLIEEYIQTGRPVGSGRIEALLEGEVSSATIRNIFRELEQEGYVAQPHTSAGRIPTDTGFRYYVDNLRFRQPTDGQVERIRSSFVEFCDTYGTPARATAKLLAQMAQAMAVSGWPSASDVHGAGLSRLFQSSDGEGQRALQEISELVDRIDEYLEPLAERESHGVEVYIGGENPLAQTEYSSMLVRTAQLPEGGRAVLLIMGPKRMPYRKHVSLLNNVASVIEQSYD